MKVPKIKLLGVQLKLLSMLSRIQFKYKNLQRNCYSFYGDNSVTKFGGIFHLQRERERKTNVITIIKARMKE
jgi:hypothetical protein